MVKKSATFKAMDYLARRDHSRKELARKLKVHDYSEEDIEKALDHVEKSGWLLSPEVMAEKLIEQLHKKMKSHFYIQAYLRQKGLPSVPKDRDREQEKARKLLENRFSRLSKPSPEDKKQMVQYLKNRGYDADTIMKVIHETHGDSQGL